MRVHDPLVLVERDVHRAEAGLNLDGGVVVLMRRDLAENCREPK